MNIAGSIALITGGASGPGLATARRPHDAGPADVETALESAAALAGERWPGGRSGW